MNRNSGIATLAAALIVGGSILYGALAIRGALQQTGEEIASLRDAIGRAPRPPAEPARQARPARPDPSERYEVSLEGAPSKGAENAKVTIVEFSDFQCPFCSRVNSTLERIATEYGEDVRLVFKHLPLSIHPKAPAAHAAAEAAHRQGRFWEMHDAIFADQAGMSPERYLEYARQIGLDVDRFQRDLADPGVQRRVSGDVREAQELGVNGTPGFFVNGRFLSGAQPFESFQRLIDEELGAG